MSFQGYYVESSEFNSPRESYDDALVATQIRLKSPTAIRRSRSIGNGNWSDIVGIKSPEAQSTDTWSGVLGISRPKSLNDMIPSNDQSKLASHSNSVYHQKESSLLDLSMSTNPNISKSMDNANGHITAQPGPDDSSNINNNDSSSTQSPQQQQQSSSSSSIQSSSSQQVSTSNNNQNVVPNVANVPNVVVSSLTGNKAPLQKPNTTISRPPRQSGMSAQDHYVNQISMARNANNQAVNVGGAKPDDYDPDSNVYVANLPSDYGKERLYQLFSKYGQIVRYKFVTPDEPSQPGYGFVQFANRKDAHRAIKNLEGHLFSTGDTIYLSIALRRRSSLSDEPTNLYVKNLPPSWTNDKLRKVFGAYGQIRQSKVVGDGIAFVRFEDHDQALNAIGRLDKQMVEQGCKLEVRFATRKTAANAYRLQQIPQSKTNENNLYIRNLPKYYNQSSLETLFSNYGKISSAKINDNGIAFVRFAHAEDAKRAIQELNGKKPPQFEEEIVVKLAHFDIGDSRNRWANKFGPGGNLGGGQGSGQNATSNGNHFNQNMYQNHFNAPIGSMNSFNAFNSYGGSGAMAQNNMQNTAPLSSVPSSSAAFNDPSNNDVNVNVNMNNLNTNITSNGNMQNLNGNINVMNQMNQMNVNNQMAQIQQQMQQWQLNNAATNAQQGISPRSSYQPLYPYYDYPHSPTSSLSPSNEFKQLQSPKGNGITNQFAFPAATPVMMQAPTLFNMNQQQNGVNNMVTQQQATNNVNMNGNIPNLPSTQLGRQGSSDSHHSGGAASPQSNGSNGSGDANKGKTWSKKQQELGDKLYQKVFAKTGQNYAPKITGMLIKMGDKKAQQCIDNPQFLDEQIQIAKKLLNKKSTETTDTNSNKHTKSSNTKSVEVVNIKASNNNNNTTQGLNKSDSFPRLSALNNLLPLSNPNPFFNITSSPNVNVTNSLYSPSLSLLSNPNLLSTPNPSIQGAYFLPAPHVNFGNISVPNGNGTHSADINIEPNGNHNKSGDKWIQYEVNQNGSIRSEKDKHDNNKSNGAQNGNVQLNANAASWSNQFLGDGRRGSFGLTINGSLSSNISNIKANTDITTK